jgi:hypothetical protein
MMVWRLAPKSESNYTTCGVVRNASCTMRKDKMLWLFFFSFLRFKQFFAMILFSLFIYAENIIKIPKHALKCG